MGLVCGNRLDCQCSVAWVQLFHLTDRDREKKHFIVRKPWRNLEGFWWKLDMIGVIDDLGGFLSEVQKFCGNNILGNDSRVPEQDLVEGQKIFVFFTDKILCWENWTDGEIFEWKQFLDSNDRWFHYVLCDLFLFSFMSTVLRCIALNACMKYYICQNCQCKGSKPPMHWIQCYVCQYCQYWYLWLLYNPVCRVLCTVAPCPSKREDYIKKTFILWV